MTDLKRRKFLSLSSAAMGCVGLTFAAVPFVRSFNPARDRQRAAEPITVDVSRLKPGQLLKVLWQGKPVWILSRTTSTLEVLSRENADLVDPFSMAAQQPDYAKNVYRSRDPRYFVALGVCTHLGCSPVISYPDGASNPALFLCPCHGSRFDLAGRVYKGGAAGYNLAIPPYYFSREGELVIGRDSA